MKLHFESEILEFVPESYEDTQTLGLLVLLVQCGRIESKPITKVAEKKGGKVFVAIKINEKAFENCCEEKENA